MMDYDAAVRAYNAAQTDVDRYRYATYAYTAASGAADATWPGSAGRSWHASANFWRDAQERLGRALGIVTIADSYNLIPEWAPAGFIPGPPPVPPAVLPAGQREAWLEVRRLAEAARVTNVAYNKAENRERWTYVNVPAASQERADAEAALHDAAEADAAARTAYHRAMDAYVDQYGYPGGHQDLLRQFEREG